MQFTPNVNTLPAGCSPIQPSASLHFNRGQDAEPRMQTQNREHVSNSGPLEVCRVMRWYDGRKKALDSGQAAPHKYGEWKSNIKFQKKALQEFLCGARSAVSSFISSRRMQLW